MFKDLFLFFKIYVYMLLQRAEGGDLLELEVQGECWELNWVLLKSTGCA